MTTQHPIHVPRSASWLDQHWTADGYGWWQLPWPNGTGQLDFSVRLHTALAGAKELRSAGDRRTPLTCWRQIVEASLASILAVPRIGRGLAAELLGHLRAVGVEPAWGAALKGDRTRKRVMRAGPDHATDEFGVERRALAEQLAVARSRVAELEQERDACLKAVPRRTPLPDVRQSITHRWEVGGTHGYVTVGLYPDGRPGELFVVAAKEGATLRGLLDAWARAVSLLLQYGVPLADLTRKFSGFAFEPAGWTTEPRLGHARSIIDYLARWLTLRFGAGEGEGQEQAEATQMALPTAGGDA